VRIVHTWVDNAGLASSVYGTHAMRRTKAALIRRRGTCEQFSFCSDNTKLESTVRYLGIEVDDALSIAEQVEL
jgi:hypothetical protein